MITQHTFNTAMQEINDSYAALLERIEKLEKAQKTEKKTKSLSNVKNACNDDKSVV